MKKANVKGPKFRFNKKIIKLFFLIIIIVCSYLVTISYFSKKNIDVTDKEYVQFLINKSYNKSNNNYTFIVNESLKLLSKLDLTKPETMLDSRFVSKDNKENTQNIKDATASGDDYEISTYEKLTSYISNPNNNESNNPVVYLYNTHQLETYSNSRLESFNVTPNIMMVSYLLSEKLNKKNIGTIAEDTNIAEFMKMSNIKSSEFYATSRIFLNNAKTKYPSLKYYIDLHRDSVSKNISTCEIDNKKYARILFVIGTSNKTYEQNEAVAKKIDEISDSLYPCLSRGIFKRNINGWDKAYNQDISGNVMLIEIGAKENTMDEVLNTVDALSIVLEKYIKGE